MATYLKIKIREKISHLNSIYANYKIERSARDIETYYRIRKNYYDMNPYQALKRDGVRVDYELKSLIFDKFAYELKCVRKYRYWQYLHSEGCDAEIREDFLNSLDSKQSKLWLEYIFVAREMEFNTPELFKEMVKIINADRQRRLRLKNRISGILNSGNAYFVTLTFNDDTLKNSKDITRRGYVTDVIKKVSDNYVGNIDYGAKRGREHYHVVLQTDKFENLDYRYYKGVGYSATYSEYIDEWKKHGIYFIKKCGKEDSDAEALARYTTKLTNHAIKETTKRNALIYSR